MARRCQLSGKNALRGNRVSHSNRKTPHHQRPNIQRKRIYVPELGRYVRVKVSTRALRTITNRGFMRFLKSEGLTLKDVLG